MNLFANVKIGRKIAVFMGGTILLLSCMAAIMWWGLDAITGANEESQQQNRKIALAGRVSGDVDGVVVRIANSVIAKQARAEDESRIQGLRKEYLSTIEELRALTKTEEGKRQLEALEQAIGRATEADNRILGLAQAGKRSEAGAAFQSALSIYDATEAAARDYTKFREKRLDEVTAQLRASMSRIWFAMILFGVIAVALAGTFGTLLSRSIAKPLEAAVGHLDQVARGDISRDLPREYLARKDEIGSVSRALQTMSASLRDMMGRMGEGVHVLSSSSVELTASSGQMSSGSRKASEKIHSVAAAAEQMSANMSSVAAGMEQTSSNLTSVASSTEQMTATIGEIAGNAEKARRISEEATRQAASIDEQMKQLGEAARQIGKVTETITEISSQTNLLALNATIEAARAGSAGKGFAVVAGEIKDLAQQAATATDDIRSRIDSVQTSTASGIAGIEKISHVIHEVGDIVSSIAAAIEEQATVTKDIARNIAEASAGVGDADKRVSQTSQVSLEVARDIVGVDQAAGAIAAGSEEVRASASELSKVAEQLQETMTRFRV